MAAFYVQFKVDTFKRQMKESKKEGRHARCDGKWNVELNNHIVQFIKLLRESHRNLSHVTPELMARMDVCAAKLAPPQGQAQSDSGYDSSSTLFQIRANLLYPEVDKLRGICTERAALLDLKTCLENIAASEPFPGCREDLDNEATWQFWKTLETSHLSQLMVALVKSNPELAKSIPNDVLTRPTSSRSNCRSWQRMQAEQENRERQQHKRKTQGPGGVARIPDVQTVPEIPWTARIEEKYPAIPLAICLPLLLLFHTVDTLRTIPPRYYFQFLFIAYPVL
ncbi:hypothetical protein BJV78DRAFT_1279306 [Lactifluus subvellereus]|nr:hypothetical protein BJV78DRAFT_1279306 [Lactifluus subvellereus]